MDTKEERVRETEEWCIDSDGAICEMEEERGVREERECDGRWKIWIVVGVWERRRDGDGVGGELELCEKNSSSGF